MKNIVFDSPTTLKLIDWENVINAISSATFFDKTKALLAFIPNKIDLHFINEKIITYKHFEDYYFNTHLPISDSFSHFNSNFLFEDKLFYLSKSGVLNFNELNQFILLIEFNLFHKDYTNYNFPDNEIRNKVRYFRSFVEKDGYVDLNKNPIFSKIHNEFLELEKKIRNYINLILKDVDVKDRLQYDSFDIYNDRFVIPLRSDSYNSSIGQIISRSDTGHTLYVEPYQVRELSNRRLQLLNEIEEIKYNICKEFSLFLKGYHDDLKFLLDNLYDVDYNYSLFSFYKTNTFCFPTISNKPQIFLKGFFHPLISNPVKNDINITDSSSGFIISGPNMGGKTATLKSLSLSYLFFAKGFKLPAHEASFFPYQNIFYFGHDDQNLASGESSFSSEVKNYIKMLENLSDTNLIVLDEIFNSTSSEEASALAISIFKYINENSTSHILVSTHHQMLKTFIHQDKKFISSHVGFIEETNSPNYKLYFDGPGSSHAIEIFKRIAADYDFSSSIISHAENTLDKKLINYENLLRDLSYKNGLLDQKLIEVDSIRKDLLNQKKAQEGLLKLKYDNELSNYKIKFEKILEEAYKIQLDDNINTKNKVKKLENLKSSEFFEDESKPLIFEDTKTNNSSVSLIIGEFYFCTKLKSEVILKSLDNKKKTATVARKNLTINVPISSLIASKNKSKIDVNVHITRSSNKDAKLTHDCRGMRVDEFESYIEAIFSTLYSGEIPFIEVIHGHGDGVLKKSLRNLLKINTDLTIDEKNDGNEGSTRIVLKY